MKRLIAAALFSGAIIVGLVSTSAAAPLIDKGTSTYDPNTRLEWLDLPLTLGLSFNETSASSYVLSDGYRFATEAELFSLYASANVVPGTPYIVSNAAGVIQLLNLVGCTTQCNIGGAGQGWLNEANPFGGIYYAFYQYGYAGGFAGRATGAEGPASKDTQYRDTGSFLVRTVVPLPAGVWLLLSALIGLGLMGRRGEDASA